MGNALRQTSFYAAPPLRKFAGRQIRQNRIIFILRIINYIMERALKDRAALHKRLITGSKQKIIYKKIKSRRPL